MGWPTVSGRGRPEAGLELTDAQRDQLTRWSRRAKTAQALALRSKIALACAQGTPNTQVAADLRITPGTVTRWRRRLGGVRGCARGRGVKTLSALMLAAPVARLELLRHASG